MAESVNVAHALSIVELDAEGGGGVDVAHTVGIIELDTEGSGGVDVAHTMAIMELEPDPPIVITTEVTTLAEISADSIAVRTTQIGILAELSELTGESYINQLGTLTELGNASSVINQLGALTELGNAKSFIEQIGVLTELELVSNYAYILDMYGDAFNYIRLYFSTPTELTLAFNDGDGEHSATLDVTTLLYQDITYQFVIEYNALGMTLSLDCDVLLTINEPVDFDVVPTLAYWGKNKAGEYVASANFSVPVDEC
jgi:hypothetical protein